MSQCITKAMIHNFMKQIVRHQITADLWEGSPQYFIDH